MNRKNIRKFDRKTILDAITQVATRINASHGFMVDGIDIYKPGADLSELKAKLDLMAATEQSALGQSALGQSTSGQSSTGPSTSVQSTSGRGNPNSAKPSNPESLATLTDWQIMFSRNLQRFPSSVKSSMAFRRSLFKIDEVYEEGIIVGRYVDGGTVYQIYAAAKVHPAGCSCQSSDGQYACQHCYGFTELINEELIKSSSLAARIQARDFTQTKFDKARFRFDANLDSLNKLLRFVGRSPTEVVDLPPLQIVKRERVAWQISLEGRRPTLSLLVQAQKKRSDDWTKGRTTSLYSLDDGVERTPADEQALELYGNTYGSGLESAFIEALTCLIGQPNVIYGGKTIEILPGSACLKLVEGKDGWQVHLSQADRPQESLRHYFATDGVISFDQEDKYALVTRATVSQTQCMESLCSVGPFKQEHHVQLLLDRCHQLQSVVNILLPEKFGPIVENQSSLVMMLRFRTDGFLDYGIRVRDALDQLHLPGCGMLIVNGKKDDQPIQLKRSFEREQEQVRQLQRQLGLSPNQPHGKVTFEQGLHLLEELQQIPEQVDVLWDKESETPLRSLGTVSSKNLRVSIQQKRDWFQLNGLCELSGGTIELKDLMNTLSSPNTESIGNFVRIGDRGWAMITDELKDGLQKLADSVNHERGQMKFDQTAALAMRDLQGHLQIDATRPWQTCLERLATAEALEPEVPKLLQAELRDYQTAGFKWLRRLAEWGVGGVLADDMGLGKTVQTLAVLVDRADRGPTLVIAPTSVGFNWLREIKRFAPHLTTHSYRETDRNEFFQQLGPQHIVVCSYGLALRDVEKLAKVEWSNMVLDEAQAIKNSQSKTSQAIATIDADWKIALTGTPVENHLGELWSLFRIISPGVFGGWEQFRNRFATPIERNNDEDRRKALRDRLKPFILRRTKGEVLRDLPARTESNLIVELNDKERKLYDKYRMSILDQANEIANLPDVKDQRFKLLALLTRLRQIACHPRLVEKSWKERSTKLEQLLETLKELRDEGHRTLIFSQFVQHLGLIREMMDEEKISYQYLDGSTTPTQRQEQVDQFQNGQATAFLISLKAGGTGLNLTAADYVIHMDPWWNPAVEDQATDRAHRIGQTKPVMVYRLIAKNTVEEEILKLHEDKRDLVAGILDGTHAASSLSTQELIALLTK